LLVEDFLKISLRPTADRRLVQPSLGGLTSVFYTAWWNLGIEHWTESGDPATDQLTLSLS